jgi:hypothetical protein
MIMLKAPELFWLWFIVVIPVLFAVKFTYYRSLHWHYFLIDFCYFANLSCILEILLFPRNSIISKVRLTIIVSPGQFVCLHHDFLTLVVCFIFTSKQMNFLFANGPLAMAIPVWRNAIVFHDLDRISSTYIHSFPVLLCFCSRWYPNTHVPAVLSTFYSEPTSAEEDSPLTMWHMIPALISYLMWQILYLFKTEVMDREVFETDLSIQTSLSWLTSDSKNFLHQLVRGLLRKLKIMRKDETFNSKTMKTKLIFVTAQLIYTLLCFLPSLLFYHNFYLHVFYLTYLITTAVHNGASYYIEVFSRKYVHKFDGLDGWSEMGPTKAKAAGEAKHA